MTFCRSPPPSGDPQAPLQALVLFAFYDRLKIVTRYLGLGPGAHSLDGKRRWGNRRDVAAYTAAVDNRRRPIDGSETLEPGDLALETLLLRLRTFEGIDLPAFRQRFGFDLAERNQRLIEECIPHGQLRLVDDRLQPTVAGLAVADRAADYRRQHKGDAPVQRVTVLPCLSLVLSFLVT